MHIHFTSKWKIPRNFCISCYLLCSQFANTLTATTRSLGVNVCSIEQNLLKETWKLQVIHLRKGKIYKGNKVMGEKNAGTKSMREKLERESKCVSGH